MRKNYQSGMNWGLESGRKNDAAFWTFDVVVVESLDLEAVVEDPNSCDRVLGNWDDDKADQVVSAVGDYLQGALGHFDGETMEKKQVEDEENFLCPVEF